MLGFCYWVTYEQCIQRTGGVANDRIVTREFILVDSRPQFVLKVIVMVLSMLASINPVMEKSNSFLCVLIITEYF